VIRALRWRCDVSQHTCFDSAFSPPMHLSQNASVTYWKPDTTCEERSLQITGGVKQAASLAWREMSFTSALRMTATGSSQSRYELVRLCDKYWTHLERRGGHGLLDHGDRAFEIRLQWGYRRYTYILCARHPRYFDLSASSHHQACHPPLIDNWTTIPPSNYK